MILGARFAGADDAGATYVVYGGPSGEFLDPAISTDGKTATWTDVDGDRVALKISGTTAKLTNANFQLLAKASPTRARSSSRSPSTTPSTARM